MATSEAQIRQELEQEREKLAEAVETLREELGEATDVSGRLRAKLPIATAGALATGFVAAGGIGATMRLIFRRGREDDVQVRFRLRR
jgi:hypothetical protein